MPGQVVGFGVGGAGLRRRREEKKSNRLGDFPQNFWKLMGKKI